MATRARNTDDPMTDDYRYEGDELTLFREAHRWKAYLRAAIRRDVRGSVLEVGAGLGGTTRAIRDATDPAWTCLEPDASLCTQLRSEVSALPSPDKIEVREGTLASMPESLRFDTILYVDVLEHIADDRDELARAAAHLTPGGAVIVLSPAHQWLFTPFDTAVGHHRRYTLDALRAITPAGASMTRAEYLDSVGLLASLGNRLLLRQGMPTARQVALWDRVMVPLSRRLDPVLAHRVGKSVLAVWRKTA